MRKQLVLARLLWHTRLLGLLRGVGGRSLVVLNYHRLRATAGPPDTQFEGGVFGPTAEAFEREVAWLARHTDCLSEDEVIRRLDAGLDFGTPSTLVTFDDGYADNYEIAYPILRRHGVPATFFIPTELVASRRLGWWDLIAYLVKRSQARSVEVDGLVVSLADVEAAVDALVARLKSQKTEPDDAFLERLSRACGVPLPGPELQGRELLTWDQIREVSRNGVSIGSHSHTHPALARMNPEAQREELATSRKILEREVGRPVRSVAYPFGGAEHFGRDTQSIAAECGFEIGFSFRRGVNRRGELDRFGLLRLRAPDEPELLAASAVLPGLFRDRPRRRRAGRGAPGHEGSVSPSRP
jgi:peptidoglycan/xylan/chitin deacetylase (PgdA/CDA1 family)